MVYLDIDGIIVVFEDNFENYVVGEILDGDIS